MSAALRIKEGLVVASSGAYCLSVAKSPVSATTLVICLSWSSWLVDCINNFCLERISDNTHASTPQQRRSGNGNLHHLHPGLLQYKEEAGNWVSARRRKQASENATMAPRISDWSAWITLVLAALCLAFPGPPLRAAGVTIITHGLNGNVDDWVIAMADRTTDYDRFPGTSFTCYELYFILTNSNYALTWRRLGGSAPPATDSGEILIKLDWRQLANDSYSTYDVAAAVVPRLLQPNFISEMNGHALAELPLHLIGHSRGGSLVCQLSRLLGTNGVWLDHLTTLDAHPLNNDGFFDFPYTVVD